MPSKIKKRHFLDYSILIPYLILTVIGLIFVYSSTSYLLITNDANPASLVMNQGIFWVLSLIMISLMYKMKTDVLKSQQLIIVATYFIFALLIVVFFIGDEVNGAKGWIRIGSFSMQPAEYLKIMVVWYLSYILSKRQETIQDNFVTDIKRPLILVFAMIFLVAVQPDMGNAAIITLLALVLLLASGINWVISLIVGGVGIVGSFLAIEFLTRFGSAILPEKLQYIVSRFESFKNPFKYELDQGHQMVNGYYAMFNGGWFGRGLGNSIEKKGFLSEAHTDFIFSIVIEEVGLIGALIILAILIFMIARIYLVGIRSKKPFNSLICIGIGSLLLLQVFINLGGILGIIPLTGITFPFLSQGGNSLLVLSVGVAFALNISADEKRTKLAIEYEYLKSQE
ncbi:FtsW/RodA/SpoVE family cell cycle protein [Enterococcus dongliensis]|uniref:Probable peptidoglycan glycosyltransferase FtsW n=1 Tax=Enterococcus dongliensis TaxID=2559925 RepID=A0AAP5NIC7_9ENTE|nr:FtsW/RodA/SpoVE family cell cycle protein [Enterococcus dongliensis]MDT2595927.1 FtsW/RodA/SpoVE family cell cycle protein [Enterococcus dongliensis]MDT2602812.1 FtsW/RodA/SpoVE family cell cycle protein [Enterococcus dongliensis]MDT2612272.1 FtsW/RodA/SpoVE family cell cycle protein [Enterococcus dongliensis]MDT2633994.1 FtsW/RodA/SpoVE family cell cycle protein [Enterococcus dongliensis]MDT2637244.1 FtsW/RodA/SpoVE family cell cycle protein [Enterococcus dongliensis]